MKKVWLQREVIGEENGQFQLRGDCGMDRIVVVLDPSITAKLPRGAQSAAILEMHAQIEDAATWKHREGESYPVHEYHSPHLKHQLIALTDEDLEASERRATQRE